MHFALAFLIFELGNKTKPALIVTVKVFSEEDFAKKVSSFATLKMKKDEMDVVKLNDFPNEVLAMIFARIPFVERLQISRVCHRWNQLIFRFFGDQILLKMDGQGMTLSKNRPGWLTERNYRNISLKVDKNHLDLDNAFNGIQNKLVYLSVHIGDCPPENVDGFQKLLPKLINLKTLKISQTEEHFKTISTTIFNQTSIESLTITFAGHVIRSLRLLEGLHRMSSLKRLHLQAASFSYPRNFHIQPVPQVEQLEFRKILAANIRKYSLAFPSLRVLDIFSMKRTDQLLTDLTRAWPALEVLTLRVNLGFLKSFTLGILLKLRKLRKLCLLDGANQLPEETSNYLRSLSNEQPDLSLLGVLLEIPTLGELHVDGKWTGSVPTVNTSCQLFINGVHHSR